eukprot:CAMPEP_0113908094 /NCGR_PEP_ID=MMETSP0780_2-20120614/25930_1 /TAXON_ID=652834 /ORGANISM="Palpitomonas bilix" /LENGTH=255 /DNA_ID=CAMNT_0000903403 /DNA_START=32 /DNA_END=799 /DNA_ORIENTATION=- /assembly_acc=CAM_ASM_000599
MPARVLLAGLQQTDSELDVSPFVARVAAVLHLAGVDFKYFNMSSKDKDKPRTTNGKHPAATVDGKTITDSFAIMNKLKECIPQVKELDSHISPLDHATFHAMETMLAESVYWTSLIFPRWIDDEGYSHTFQNYFAKLVPRFMKFLIVWQVRGTMKQQYKSAGFGRMPVSLVMARVKNDLESMSILLGKKKFFGGDSPCIFDATAFAFLNGIHSNPVRGTDGEKPRQLLLSFTNLVEYINRVGQLVHARKCTKSNE